MTGSGATAPMGQAAHAPPQAHDPPGGGERHDNCAAGGVRPRNRLGCRGFRLNRRVASAPVCARAARCRKGSVAAQNGAPGARAPRRPAQLSAAPSRALGSASRGVAPTGRSPSVIAGSRRHDPAMHLYLRHQVIIMISQVTRCIGERNRAELSQTFRRFGMAEKSSRSNRLRSFLFKE
jgi:hypothetical protein